MFYIQFFKRNPFLKRKKQKKNFRCVKNAFFGQNLPKKWFFCTFLHILCTFLHYSYRVQCCPCSRPWETGIWHDFRHFFFSKTAKNGQKWQKWPKTAKKRSKMRFFFFFFCLLVFPLLCRHFICCSLKRSKIAQNGQKWPKTAQNGIFGRFWVRKNFTPPV